MDAISMNGRVIPTNFGLKYNPPKLGIQYYFKENPKATFVHEVKLEDVESKKSEDLLNDLFINHKKFVDPKVVSRNQLQTLMEKLKTHITETSVLKNKENMNENINNPTLEDEWGLEINSAQKEEQLIKPQDFEKDLFSGDHKEDFNDNDKNFMLDDFNMDKEDEKVDEAHDMFEGLEDPLSEQKVDHPEAIVESETSAKKIAVEGNDDDDDSDAIDIDNEEELAARGLKKIQIEGEEEEFLMDGEGNIYNLNGDFIGTTNGDGEEEGDAAEGAEGGEGGDGIEL